METENLKDWKKETNKILKFKIYTVKNKFWYYFLLIYFILTISLVLLSFIVGYIYLMPYFDSARPYIIQGIDFIKSNWGFVNSTVG